MKFTNNHNIPLPLAIWLASDEYQYAKTVNEISTTTLMRSPRYIIATRRAMYPEQFKPELRLLPAEQDLFLQDLTDRVSSRMGVAIHSSVDWTINNRCKQALEALGCPSEVVDRVKVNPDRETLSERDIAIFTEQRAYKPVRDFVISGQFDAVVNGEVQDIKSTSTFSWTSGAMDKKYVLQMSIYRWLNPEIITKDTCTINFIFTDWNKNYAFSRDDYPKSRAAGKTFQLLSLADTEAYVKDKLNQLKKYWNEPLATIPCCTDEDLYSAPPIYKYYKNGYEEGKRSTKNFDNYNEASLYRAKHNGTGEIIVDKGKPFKCPCCDIGILGSLGSDNIEPDKLDLEIG